MTKPAPIDLRVEAMIPAPPEAVYDLVADIARMGEWSPETTEAEWLGDATTAEVGARFKGTNALGKASWATKPTITEATRGRTFAFKVPGKSGPTWRYEFEAVPRRHPRRRVRPAGGRLTGHHQVHPAPQRRHRPSRPPPRRHAHHPGQPRRRRLTLRSESPHEPKARTMQYMIFHYSDESTHPELEPGTPEFAAMMGEWMALNQSLIEAGQFVGGASLVESASATMLTKGADGGESVTDGPYADTKEQIGGFYIVDVPDLDAALEIARRIPIPVGRFEIRPVAFNPSTDL